MDVSGAIKRLFGNTSPDEIVKIINDKEDSVFLKSGAQLSKQKSRIDKAIDQLDIERMVKVDKARSELNDRLRQSAARGRHDYKPEPVGS